MKYKSCGILLEGFHILTHPQLHTIKKILDNHQVCILFITGADKYGTVEHPFTYYDRRDHLYLLLRECFPNDIDRILMRQLHDYNHTPGKKEFMIMDELGKILEEDTEEIVLYGGWTEYKDDLCRTSGWINGLDLNTPGLCDEDLHQTLFYKPRSGSLHSAYDLWSEAIAKEVHPYYTEGHDPVYQRLAEAYSRYKLAEQKKGRYFTLTDRKLYIARNNTDHVFFTYTNTNVPMFPSKALRGTIENEITIGKTKVNYWDTDPVRVFLIRVNKAIKGMDSLHKSEIKDTPMWLDHTSIINYIVETMW